MHSMEVKWIEAEAGVSGDGLGIVALVLCPEEGEYRLSFTSHLLSDPGNYYSQFRRLSLPLEYMLLCGRWSLGRGIGL